MTNRLAVLVVDDDEDILCAVSEALSDEGYEVRARTGGEEALDDVRGGFVPDVILLDCLMPAPRAPALLDGLARCGARAPVLLFSAADRMARALAPRVAGIVRKPCGVDELLGAIEAVAVAPRLERLAQKPLAAGRAPAAMLNVAVAW